MAMVEVGSVEKIFSDAQAEIDEETSEKAKKAIKAKLRELSAARQVVANIEAQVRDLKASILDGSFTG
jgi:hypothetical protein